MYWQSVDWLISNWHWAFKPDTVISCPTWCHYAAFLLVIRWNMAPLPTVFSLSDGDVALGSASSVFGASFTDPLFKLITNQSASSSGVFSFSHQLLPGQSYRRWTRSLRDDKSLLYGNALHNESMLYEQKFVDTWPPWSYVLLPQTCMRTAV